MIKSFEDINQFVQVAQFWLSRHTTESKLRYAVKKQHDAMTKLFAEFEIEREDISIEHCATDKDGVILRDDKGNFQFSKEDLKKRNQAVREAAKKTVEFEPYYVKPADIPGDDVLTVDEYDAFVDFVVRPRAEPTDETAGLLNGAAADYDSQRNEPKADSR